MANSLLDIVQKKRKGGSPDPGQQIKGVSQAATGKAARSGSGPKLSKRAQRAQRMAGEAKRSQVRKQGRFAEEQLSAQQERQEKQTELQERGLEQQEQDITQRFKNETESILNSLQREGEKLDQQEKEAAMEQAGFMIRMQNKEYVNDLQREAAKENLGNELEFREQLKNSVFEDEMDILEKSLDLDAMLAADDREFKKQMAKMDLKTAQEMAEQAAQAQSKRAVAGGVGTAISAGTSVWAENPDMFKSEQDDPDFVGPPEPMRRRG